MRAAAELVAGALDEVGGTEVVGDLLGAGALLPQAARVTPRMRDARKINGD
ncbi:MAG: hypothetical protein ACRDNZ_22175 [Streptosporangiaceae bacterium]